MNEKDVEGSGRRLNLRYYSGKLPAGTEEKH
jgi:hypothetical protein